MKFQNTTYIIFFSLLVVFTACEHESIVPPNPANGEEIEINFSLAMGGGTRAMTDEDENAINDINVLVFKEGYFVDRSKAEEGSITNIGGPQRPFLSKNFKIKLKTDESASNTLAIIANAGDIIDEAEKKASFEGLKKDDVLKQFVFTNNGKWPAAIGTETEVRPIPMWGEPENKRLAINKELENYLKTYPVPLYRALARVDLINQASNFNLKKIYLHRYNTEGLIAPASNTTWKKHPVTGEDRVTSVNVPTGTNPEPGELQYTLKSSTGLIGEIYVLEAERAVKNDYANATCLVLEGNYNNDPVSSFYRIDFEIVWYDKNTGKMDIEAGLGEAGQERTFARMLRNHVYEITIKSVSRKGAPSLDEALANTDSQISNMEVKAATWNRRDINIIF